MLASSELIDLVKEYNLEANVDLLKKAYMFAMDVHGVQKRASGIPYFCHPVEVACLLIELRLDVPTIIAGLLHDTQEDAGVTSEELEEIFGAEIAFLVDGVTKLSKINYPTSTTYQAENFQKFILAVSRDIRVLLIKLADRLNNMRTINNIFSIEKRKGIALETLRVYAPLAGRMGMSTIKDEMEDKAFHILHPEEYNAIFLRLNKIRNEDQDFIQNTIVELKEILAGAKIDSDISGREKKIYSIWKKMQNRNVSLERINDIMAFRIVVATVQQCYSTLGVIHTHFQIVPGKFKDYISIPKLNNYQSLHTTVIGPSRQAIEIQIRTKEMHQTANKGIAAHLLYKNEEIVAEKENFQIYSELKNMITAIQNSGSSEEIIHHSKLELFDNKVFCFTPKGDLIILPYNATAIDFAYEIHTAVGNTCAGVKVNGKVVPVATILKNGDIVDVLTSPYRHPEAIWGNFVVTGKAKSNIRKFIKMREKDEFTILGQCLTKYIFSSADMCLVEDSMVLERFFCKTLNEFYYKLGKGIVSFDGIQDILFKSNNRMTAYKNHLCLMNLIPGIAVHFSDCCHPILEDKIIGILVPQKGLVIHTTSCSYVDKSGSTLIMVRWNQNNETGNAFVTRLRITILNKKESFAVITNIISANEASIINLKMEHRSVDFFDLLVDIKVKDIANLGEIQASLRVCSNVKSVRSMAQE